MQPTAAPAAAQPTEANVLDWRGWLNKKALKTLTKNNWKRCVVAVRGARAATARSLRISRARASLHPPHPPTPSPTPPRSRFFHFDAAALKLSYYERDPSTAAVAPKGTFELSASDLFATPTTDYGRQWELKVSSKGQVLFAAAESEADQQALLTRIDIARRLQIAGDDGKELVPSSAAERAAQGGIAFGEPGVKAFVWGVGGMLAMNNPAVQGMAFPQRVQGLKAP